MVVAPVGQRDVVMVWQSRTKTQPQASYGNVGHDGTVKIA
jgi:hypothetical protein